MTVPTQRGAGGGEMGGGNDGGNQRVVSVATWNMSRWTEVTAEQAMGLGVDLVALQETRLAAVELNRTQRALAARGWKLHHGAAVPERAGGVAGVSCGTGFLVAPGRAVTPLNPIGGAWRRLHAAGRIHAVRIPDSDGQGHLRVVSVYAPYRRGNGEEKEVFADAMWEMVSGWDMQEPTLLIGDFNGSVNPQEDYSKGGTHVTVCPLLSALVGPGGPFVEVRPVNPQFTFEIPCQGEVRGSRIDLCLANRSARGRVVSVEVRKLDAFGHSPVVVTVKGWAPTIQWFQGRRTLPEVLCLAGEDLLGSEEWSRILVKLTAAAGWMALVERGTEMGREELAQKLDEVLEQVVQLAGGWKVQREKHRRAFDSPATNRLRRREAALTRAVKSVGKVGGIGTWPWRVGKQLGALGVRVEGRSPAEVMGSLLEERKRVTADLRRSLDRQRAERIKRWKERVTQLWHTRPGAVYRWLEDDTPAWGTAPIVNQEGRACSTPEEVDTEVRRFWVDKVLRKHQGVDGEAAWEGFAGSEFAAHIPRAEWPVVAWDGALVRKTLGRMRASASPGSRGVPIAVWKAMPEEWHAWIARLLGLVEEEGQWPEGTLDAYVAMIPKASGGSRPQDQRPITVLDVTYRLWAKAQVEAWSPVMQREVLGEAAMGFRWESGTRNASQLVTDVAEWQRMRGKPVWMVSFDVAKCYDTIPWWAVFGVMEAAGMSQRVVATFRDFYTRLRRRFRYGVLDGGVWQATNGLAQGCPASPDMLNLLYEGFHRWARAKRYGVAVGECVIPSASFADDVGLMGETWREVLPVVVGYLDFVARILLEVQVLKTQVWTSDTKACGEVEIAGVKVKVADSFRMVGVELGTQEKRLVTKHLEARLAKAVRGVERLRALAVPHAIASRIWNARIVPQVVYGCEVVAVTGLHLDRLIKAGRAMAASKTPIRVSGYRATEVFSGQPLGESRLADPMLVVRKRQLSWLQVLLNGGGLVGWVHRRVCGVQERGGIRWHERTVALQQALDAMGWKVVVNQASARAQAWPTLETEPSFRGRVLLKPSGEEVGGVAAWTDGSLRGSQGGAAALLSVQGRETRTTTVAVADARSSTQCELVALGLAVGMRPEVVYTDSLTSLHLIRRWGQTSTAGALRCADRAEVRAFIIGCERRGVWPVLEKVKAHDAAGCSAGDAKALGNDRADALAKEAVDAERVWKAPVEADDAGWFVRGHGTRVTNVDEEAESAWWVNQRKDLITRRPWMEGLYGVEVDWEVSCWAFRTALGKGGYFYPVQPAAVKWLARVRSGALATHARLCKTKLLASPACVLCEHHTEDDEHAVMGCPGTGADRWKDVVLREWEMAAQDVPKLRTAVPSEEWLSSHGMRLCAGLIPVDARRWVEGDEGEVRKFLKTIHLAMTRRLAELMRRREELMAGNQGRARAPSGNQAAWQTITAREVVAIERVAQQLPSREEEPSVPRRGQARAKWLKGRLAQLLREHTEPRGEGEVGTTARELLEAFETTVGERFEESPGMGLTRRMTSISLVISKLAKGGELGFEMVGKRVVMTGGGYIVWSRRCTIPVEGERWFERQQAAERDEPPVATLRVQRLEVNASLGQWLGNHVKLRALEDAEEGTPSLVLLVLWEVDHGRPFPTSSSDVRNKVASFTRRMHETVRKDKRLAWLTSKAVTRPLLVGLKATRQVLWAVGLRQPMGEAFDAAWRELGSQMFAEGARPGGKRGAATRMRLAESSTTAAPARVAEAPARSVVEGGRDSVARRQTERAKVRERRAARAGRKMLRGRTRKQGKSSRAEMEGSRETAPPAKRQKTEQRERLGKRKRKKKRRRAVQEGDEGEEEGIAEMRKRAKLGGGARGWVAVRGRRRGKKRAADSQADGRRRKRTRTSHGARHGRAQEGPPS